MTKIIHPKAENSTGETENTYVSIPEKVCTKFKINPDVQEQKSLLNMVRTSILKPLH